MPSHPSLPHHGRIDVVRAVLAYFSRHFMSAVKPSPTIVEMIIIGISATEIRHHGIDSFISDMTPRSTLLRAI